MMIVLSWFSYGKCSGKWATYINLVRQPMLYEYKEWLVDTTWKQFQFPENKNQNNKSLFVEEEKEKGSNKKKREKGLWWWWRRKNKNINNGEKKEDEKEEKAWS